MDGLTFVGRQMGELRPGPGAQHAHKVQQQAISHRQAFAVAAMVTVGAQKVPYRVAKLLLDRLRGRLNLRQEKALLRVMRDGPGGLVGGLSAGKYTALTGAIMKITNQAAFSAPRP